ncbi:PsaX family [Rubidibacter lacunae KORDI 51-2]|uniref:PsaX family n=1 Tax=Rubidibacter lacunae KORDI 51-2 TaxID=582515 RepID=U5DM98_9CHRO|nr:photosystem I protein PsaX [Rubidibacter lacunae]ERN41709.1 PsaX family [Rubidibacter lacunae KORDI 51-2]
MTTNAEKPTMPVARSGQPPYPFRTAMGIFLLVVNVVVAAIYFHIFNI